MTKNKRSKRQRAKEIRTTVLSIIGLIIVFLVIGRVGYWETHYEREATVYLVEEDCIVFEDSTGNLWEIDKDTTHEYVVGEAVVLNMFTNGTDSNIYDDEIREVKSK